MSLELKDQEKSKLQFSKDSGIFTHTHTNKITAMQEELVQL